MQSRINVIPRPAELVEREGTFRLTPTTRVLADPAVAGAGAVATDLAALLAPGVGGAGRLEVHTGAAAVRGAVLVTTQGADATLGAEGYTLEVTADAIVLRAPQAAGLFYGGQTLRQLLPLDGARAVPCVRLRDVPRYAWRGYMLDSARHFQRPAFLCAMLDEMAALKLNVFHWHLVDGTAWRLAVTPYPSLLQPVLSGEGYTQAEGHYTAADVRAVVAHAQARHITIMPEIEIPGHANQAVAAVPGLICQGPDGRPLAPGTAGEFCLGAPESLAFFRDVLADVLALFPNSPYIHTGGDEAADGNWRKCPRCTAKMRELGTDNPRVLQKWFMAQVAAQVHAAGRTSVAWADHLDLGVPPGQIVHGWHAGESQHAVRHGLRTIHSTHDFTYLDYPQDASEPKFRWMPPLSLKGVYAFDPDSAGATPEQRRLVLGTEGHLWTELVAEARVNEKTFPRLLALAEVAWTPQAQREYGDFHRRVGAYLPRLAARGVGCFPRYE